eukprot:TRINITY_DN23111_c0_g1_i1.p2 TRINITY_DN23111_c0_g1~~TRINITY_DN23111_c0_g1_i1.p2  ORF type:complete len:128 (+),score=49.57 TRINITY_DN23111_c0_g1_i1:46-429(+)
MVDVGSTPDESFGTVDLETFDLTENDDFIPACKNALIEIFKRYDEDGDGFWSPQELDAYCIKCNGQPFDAEDKADLRDTYDTNDKGWLTLQGFLDLVYSQTEGDNTETWRDLKKNGYNQKLELVQQF